jgi:hypothetical protein
MLLVASATPASGIDSTWNTRTRRGRLNLTLLWKSRTFDLSGIPADRLYPE